MNPPGGFGGGGGGGGLSLSGPRPGGLGGLPPAPGAGVGGPPPPFPGFSMMPPVGGPPPRGLGLPPPGSAGPGGGGGPPPHPGAAMGHPSGGVSSTNVPRGPFPASAAGGGAGLPPPGAGLLPGGGGGVGGGGFPPLMTPPAMGMLMPEMAALTSLGVPVLAAGGRKPKNMQPPTQDMAIPPNQTIYVNNINDKVKLTELKENLKSMFKQFGEIRQIVAMSSFWRRGQAWIVFASVDAATKAIQGMQGFVYHGQPLRINYSITKSDIIAKEDGTYAPRPPGPKKPRAIREREERQRELFLQMQHQYMQMQAGGDVNGAGAAGGLTNGSAALDQQQQQQATLTTAQTGGGGGGLADQANNLKRKADAQLPSPQPPKHGDAFMPGPPLSAPAVDMNFPAMPNKVLFLENLPEDATMEGLVALFSMHPGMSEVRPVLWRRVAFVEYENELMAANAMNALQGYNMNGSQIKITYARR